MAVREKKISASAAKPKAPRTAAKSTAKTPAKTAAKPPAKPAAKSTAAGKAGATVTLRQIAAYIAEEHEMPKRLADLVLSNVVDVVVKHLRKGDRVRIGGLGILQVKKRAARMGRNPATGEAIKIKASKKVAFRAAKELKESI